MTQDSPQSAERTFEVVTNSGKCTVRALSPSVDEGGYLSFYRYAHDTGKTYVPVAGFPSGQWASWRLVDQ